MERQIITLWAIALVVISLIGIGGNAIAVEHPSMITTPVILLKGDERVSLGTGFYYGLDTSDGKMVFLVTSYHVLTGHPPQETKPPIGDNIVFYLHKDIDNPGDVKEVRFPLFTKDNKPIWLISEEFPDADVAVIPLDTSLYSDAKVVFGISSDWIRGNIKLRPTSTVTLIGYPHGYFDRTNWLPVWKTGTIASEPDVDFEGKPVFLVDISAFPGMSGSPAFAIVHGTYETVEGTMVIGRVRKFLGIYASMKMLKEEKYLEEIPSGSEQGVILHKSLELGRIWKASLITKIIEDFDRDRYESEILKNM